MDRAVTIQPGEDMVVVVAGMVVVYGWTDHGTNGRQHTQYSMEPFNLPPGIDLGRDTVIVSHSCHRYRINIQSGRLKIVYIFQ